MTAAPSHAELLFRNAERTSQSAVGCCMYLVLLSPIILLLPLGQQFFLRSKGGRLTKAMCVRLHS